MATNYPAGKDVFGEPSDPENIPLAQTGYQPTLNPADTTNSPRNHYQHHVDLGDAVEALQNHAAQVTHDHSGNSSNTAKGNKLKWEHTHETAPSAASLAAAQALADTDDGLLAIHHTLGPGAFQAAPGNHTHDYDDGTIVNAPYVRCTSNARPTPAEGLTIWETDTNRMRVYTDFGRGNGARWNILPTANIPIVRLSQTQAQAITDPAGGFVKWSLTGEDEDTFDFFQPSTSDASKQNLTITEPGVYQFDVGVQWAPGILPEMATVVVCVNGQETALRYARIQTPNIIAGLLNLPSADRSQTIQVNGKLRLSNNDVVSIKCKYGGLLPGATFINTYLDLDSKVRSRLDMHYVGP